LEALSKQQEMILESYDAGKAAALFALFVENEKDKKFVFC
jgi:hypothetical protein